MNLNLRCYARQCGDRWQAICTDLDVAADGASLGEARASLATCVELYLEGTEALPAEEQRRRLTRKAPLHVRAKWVLLSLLNRQRGAGASSLSFVLESDGLTLAHV